MNGEISARMKVALYGLLCVLLIPFVFPTWWMLTSSLKPISDIFVFPPQLFPTHPGLDAATHRCSRSSLSRSSTGTRPGSRPS